MMQGFPRYLFLLFRQSLPVLTSLALVLLAAVPLSVPGYGQIAVNAGLVCVFYWSVSRPDLFSPAAAFTLGLWQDLVTGTPIGLNALVMLVVYGLIGSQQLFLRSRNYAGRWFCFVLVAVLAALLTWLIAMILNLNLIDPSPVLFHVLLTAGAFPPLVWLLSRLQTRWLVGNA